MLSVKLVFVVVALFIGFAHSDHKARLSGGQEVDSLRQFPHHVYIVPSETGRKCGGSILNEQWIITSAKCVERSERLDLHFGQKNEYDYAAGYFTCSVNKDNVYLYPTDYDDLALIKIPVRLIFSDTIMPVYISRTSIEGLRNRFAVMPGFNDLELLWKTTSSPTQTKSIPNNQPKIIRRKSPKTSQGILRSEDEKDNLQYGMFNILDNHVCQRKLPNFKFDEYNQICTEGWGHNPNTPCYSDYGSGLLINWPGKSELVGLYSMYSLKCNNEFPAVFTYVAKYLPWIDNMIQG